MTTPVLIVLGAFVVGCAWWFGRATDGRVGSSPFVSLALPLALLFVALPIPLASLQVIQAFQNYAEAGEANSRAFALRAAYAITQPFWQGAVAAVFVLMLATAVDFRRQRLAASSADGASTTLVRTNGAGWLVVSSAAMVLPVAALVLYVGQVPDILGSAAQRLLPEPGTPAPADPGNLQAWSTMMANRLIAGLAGGTVVAVLVVSLAAVMILTVKRATISPRHAALARASAAIVTAALAVHAAFLAYRLFA